MDNAMISPTGIGTCTTGIYFILVLLSIHPSFSAKQPTTELREAVKDGNHQLVYHLDSQGHDIHQTDPTGYAQSLLHLACEHGQLDMVYILAVELDGKKYHKGWENDYMNKSPHHYAVEFDHCSLIPHLIDLDGFNDLDVTDVNGRTPMAWAAWHGRLSCIDILAARHGKTGCQVEACMRNGATVTTTDVHGETPLHHAAREGYLEAVKKLVGLGAAIDLRNTGGTASVGSQPIHLAAKWGHASIVQYLVDVGADIDAVTEESFTPLHFAAINGRVEAVKVLLALGASVDLADVYNKTPLISSAMNNAATVMELLYEADADVLFCTGKTPSHVQPIHFAAAHRAIDAVRLLLCWGVDVDTEDDEGWTPLFFAIHGVGDEGGSHVGSEEMVKELYDKGANIYHTLTNDDGPLDPVAFAHEQGEKDLVQLIGNWQIDGEIENDI